ncbi:MAG: shikimate kinase [Peptococcaceae bacterium]
MTNIALIGFMGTGKSSVGVRLAERLNWNFVDTDTRIEQKMGLCIPEIFHIYREEGFRLEESLVIKEVAQFSNYVISTGGGIVLKEENIDNLKQSSVLICLRAKPEVILERIKTDGSRPLLKDENPLKMIKKLLELRAQNYSCADYDIDTSEKEVGCIVEEILIYLKSRGIDHGKFSKGAN